ncbi:DUF2325 domain-containing protein [Chromobacterium violaceum]|uniref:Uncharacterized protein conserved in bacteria (DUF2325) n=2 Tax=Chromobacterium violaceum TaxID=536 RepID=A0A1R0MEP9_CHRVL|nr:DUF2325 domain-containing protein [Chromobacterium violaceum]AAQ60638.1 conserved hypothetical protein [Chromobacterium violaceum ATCC 12472]ATP29327.1 DUF2325 domain-containing protein [Chromobacterium violaceum]ATP33234.1 DUF2325 domain-containing protein [Chromobacterium violaceum]KJH68340.1 hypothetical protein UF16_05540 [Chromobacterium violaceum]KMN47878.1 hypothetical protein VK93_19000 [Chromobacterium violaceum]
MNAMLVGADTLGNIPDVLQNYGITIHRHLSGRNSSHQRKVDRLPAGTDLLILFTDFLGHNVMRHFRELAAEQQIRFIACRRSVCALKQSLTGAGMCEQPCAACPQRSGGDKPVKRKR